jgi:caffeoyl-CoA O-methyltransferase
MDLVDPQVDEYAKEHSSPLEDHIGEVARITRDTHEMSRMLSGPLVATLLATLVGLTQAKRVLEVGTFTGYSALAMASRLDEDGQVVTLEHDADNARTARAHFADSPHGKKIELLEGDAHKTLTTLEGPFDLAFLDADKESYNDYWEHLVRLVRPGGAIVIDNTLWGGRVLEPADNDPDTKAIDAFNKKIRSDRRVTAVLLPVRDGVTLAVREK